MREISREREREKERENKRECVFDALGSISNETCLYTTFSFIKKIDTFVHPKYSSLSPSKNGGRNHHKTNLREKKKKTKEENKREEEEQRPRITRDLNWWFWFFLSPP